MTDEHPPSVRTSAGWTAPSELAYLTPGPPPEIPIVRTHRGGLDYSTPRPTLRDPDRVALEIRGDELDGRPGPTPEGRWQYGIDLADEGEPPSITWSASSWHHEPYRRYIDAFDDADGAPIYRRWVPAPHEPELLAGEG